MLGLFYTLSENAFSHNLMQVCSASLRKNSIFSVSMFYQSCTDTYLEIKYGNTSIQRYSMTAPPSGPLQKL